MKYGGLLCNGPINVTREEIDGSIEGKEEKKKINWRKRGAVVCAVGIPSSTERRRRRR